MNQASQKLWKLCSVKSMSLNKLILITILFSVNSFAEVIRFDVISLESPAFEGRVFGDVGQYQKITAKVTIAVNPKHVLNQGIVDIDIAPVNDDGFVEAIADVVILMPMDLHKGNKRIFYEVLNRGDKISLILLNDGKWNDYYEDLDAGNGHLMNEGYSIVWSGWQGDMPSEKNQMGLQVPTISGVTGLVSDEIIFNHDFNPFVATLSYPAASLDASKAKLTVRHRQKNKRSSPKDLKFEFFSDQRSGIKPYTNKQITIYRPKGYDASAIYEFVYEAKDPKVMGLAFASVRDIVSFLRYEKEDTVGNSNPLLIKGKPSTIYAYGLGISQSGRFVRDFLYQGFNQDEKNRMVFDGLIPDVAGSRKTWVNFRFSQPGRWSQEHVAHLQPGDQFPFTYSVIKDHLTGKTDGIMKRCLETDTCPKVFHTDTATEFWQGRSSLVVTDTRGQDIDLPENVRAYYMPSTPHSEVKVEPYHLNYCQYTVNTLHNGGPMRALLHALDLWVSDGVTPPESQFPSHSNGTLVDFDQKKIGFPNIPEVSFPNVINDIEVTDYSVIPAKEGMPYPIFIPKVDVDGNDYGGIRLPDIDIPIATYVGWNIGSEGFAKGSLCGGVGSYIPFPRTRLERIQTGDPRLSIQERYRTKKEYIEKITGGALEKKQLFLKLILIFMLMTQCKEILD